MCYPNKSMVSSMIGGMGGFNDISNIGVYATMFTQLCLLNDPTSSFHPGLERRGGHAMMSLIGCHKFINMKSILSLLRLQPS
jgi:hypothetical protein